MLTIKLGRMSENEVNRVPNDEAICIVQHLVKRKINGKERDAQMTSLLNTKQ